MLLLLPAAAALAQEAPEASAEDKAKAKQAFEGGVAAYEAGRYEEALEDFQEAYRLKPHPMVRVNIANCYDKLDRPVEALFHFELFLESGAGSPEQKSEIKEAVKNLKKRVGKLVVIVTPDGTRLTIDGTDQRTAPIKEPIALRVGKHKVLAALDGYEEVTREVEIKPEATSELSLKMTRASVAPVAAVAAAPAAPLPSEVEAVHEPEAEAEAAPAAETAAPVEEAPPAATEEAPAPRRGGIPTSVWIAGGATLAFAVAGTITGVLAKSAEKNFNDNRKARFSDQLTQAQQAQAWENANAASNRTYALAITTDVMFAGALVGAGVTIYLYVKSRHAGAESEAQATVEPAIGPHSASLVAHGHF